MMETEEINKLISSRVTVDQGDKYIQCSLTVNKLKRLQESTVDQSVPAEWKLVQTHLQPSDCLIPEKISPSDLPIMDTQK